MRKLVLLTLGLAGCHAGVVVRPSSGVTADDGNVTPAAKEAAKLECAQRLVICLNVRGGILDRATDAIPRKVSPGDVVVVHVVAVTGGEIKAIPSLKDSVKVELSATTNLNTLFPGKVETKEARQGMGPQAFISVTFKVPTSPRQDAVKIVVFGRDVEQQQPVGPTTYTIPIAHGHFYLQVGVLIPFVYRGDRSVVGALVPETSLRQLQVSTDVAVTPAFSLIMFPLGHRKGSLSPFEHFSWKAWTRDFFGLQVAKDFDFASLDRWYAGLLLQPVRGLSFSGGVSLLRGQFLVPGATVGMLIDESADVDGFATDKFMLEPYLGITVDQDILEALGKGFNALRSMASSN